MRNPNGYGSVSKMSGNRRKPYIVRKTEGFNEKGNPIFKIIGYAETREKAMIMLAGYNKDPFDVDLDKITMGELFAIWYEEQAPKIAGVARQKCFVAAFKHCSTLYEKPFKSISTRQMQACIDNCGAEYKTQSDIKTLFAHLDNFIEGMDKHNTKLLKVAPAVTKNERTPFTREEIKKLWENKDVPGVDSVLFFIYTGWRITEALTLEIANINLDERTMIGGMKTEAGTNRKVPIHSLVFDFVKERVGNNNKYLFETEDGKKYTSANFRNKVWNKTLALLDIKRTPHEARHTFETMLDSAGANRKCIDLMMGHKSLDVGQRVYSHKLLVELVEAIELFKKPE
jgi:integrase